MLRLAPHGASFWLGSLLIPFSAALASAQAPNLADIDSMVNGAMKEWWVPGTAVVIVRDGHVIYLKGFGVRELEKPEKVTPDTVFALSSCTKQFTTAALAMLVDADKLTWDDPVRKHLAYFHLADPLSDRDVTIRDLLSHRTGVGEHVLLCYRAPWSQEEQIRRLGKVKPSCSFRSRMLYQNTMVGAAGLAGFASEEKWKQFIEERLTGPLGMKNVSFTTPAALRTSDHTSPHEIKGDKVVVVPWYDVSEPHPAMSLNASARDLGPWLKFQLGDGTWNGKSLVSAKNLTETHMPQIVIRNDGFVKKENPFTVQLSYGLGWTVMDYRGHQMVGHAGIIDGQRAHIMLAPDDGIGLAILSNLHGTRMNLALSNQIFDYLLGFPGYDWNSHYKRVLQEQAGLMATAAADRQKSRKADTKPALPLAAYAGAYEDPAYGTANVTLENGLLVWRWSSFRGPLEHWHLDTFNAKNDTLLDPEVIFTVGPAGVESFTVRDGLFKDEVEFKRAKQKN